MKASDDALDIIKRYEKLKLRQYLDPVGLPTIGWGHLIREGEDFSGGITKERADSMLVEDVHSAEHDIARLIKVPLNQKQYDSLVSFVFNIGGSKLAKSKTLGIINDGRYLAVPGALRTWVNGRNKRGELIKLRGLIRRREEEAKLFEAGNKEMECA